MRPLLPVLILWRWFLGAILGATIVGAQAGELITNFTIAVQSNGAIGAVEIAKAIVPYPTNAEAIKYCCNQYNIQVRVPTMVTDKSLRHRKPDMICIVMLYADGANRCGVVGLG
jgi:hypothetical protein